MFQLALQVYDSTYPRNPGVCTVRITVIRNPSAPIFRLPAYLETISEYYPIGDVAVDVEASDADGVSDFHLNFVCF